MTKTGPRDDDDTPGLVVVQVDGMSRRVLEAYVESGRMPVLGALLASGALTLESWTPLLPPCTPASQAGILHGRNDGIPGFRWYEKSTRRLLVANHARDAAELERRTSRGDGLLADGGTSIGNLLSGDAPYSHLTMATIEGRDRTGERRDGHVYPVDPLSYLRMAYGMVAEVAAEAVGARRQRAHDVRPRMARGWRYAFERAVTNVPLRMLSTDMVVREIRRGRPLVYVDFTGYDEVAHHCGPGRPDTWGAAGKIDGSLGRIVRAMARAPRPYRLVVLSDHGQSLGWGFRQRYGLSLVRFVARAMGEGTSFREPRHGTEYSDSLVRVLHHSLGTHLASALQGLLERRPGRTHGRASRVADTRGAPLAAPTDAQVADVVVCASGNLGLVYLTSDPGRSTRESLESRHPGLLGMLVGHPGIGFVVVRSSSRGTLALGRDGVNYLDEGRVEGEDPLRGYGPAAAVGLRHLVTFDDAGDLVAVGRYDPEADEVVSLEELVGSHGGLGGLQADAFIAYPSSWSRPGPLVGAPEVNRQLKRWLAESRAGGPRGTATPEEPLARGRVQRPGGWPRWRRAGDDFVETLLERLG